MHKMFIASLFFLVGCACGNRQLSYKSPEVIRESTKSVVHITIKYTVKEKSTFFSQVFTTDAKKEYMATGFSIATKDNVSFVLTNKHVCSMEDEAEYELTLFTGKKVKASFVRNDAFADICLLKTNVIIRPVKLSLNNATRGDNLLSIGSPQGFFPMIFEGFVSGYHNTNMTDKDDGKEFSVHFRAQIISVPVYPGSSGSPVFNRNSEVTGMIFAVYGDKEHISFMVPISEIWRFINVSENVFIET